MLVAVILASGLVTAQEYENQYVLDSIVVSGKSKETKERAEFIKHAQTTNVLTSYDTERNDPNFIEQSLGVLPGVQVDKRTQFGGQRVVLRGYGNDQKFNNWGVKFYLNSVPITNADGVTILEDIDFSLINNIDVIKGPASTLYGGGVGGAVKFYIEPENEKGVSLSQKTMFGSFNTFNSNTRVDAVSDNYSIMFNYGHLSSDGYRPRGNTNKNNYTFLGNFRLNSKQKLMVYATHNNSFEGVPGQISFDDYYAGKDPGNGAYGRRNAHNHFIGTRAMINHQWDILPNINNNTSVFYHTLDTERVAAGAYEITEQPSYGFRTSFNGDFKLGSSFQSILEVGGEYLISRPLVSNYRFAGDFKNPPFQTKPIEKGSYFKYNNFAGSFFASNRLVYKPLNLSLITGISGNTMGYDRNDLLNFPGLVSKPKADTSFNKNFPVVFTPHIALQKLWRNQIFNLSYSEGYNAPTASTAFIKGINKTNDNLNAEYAKMWDLSAQGTFADDKLSYQISLFNIDINDKLSKLSAKDENGNPYGYYANTGTQQNKGLEFSLGYLHRDLSFFKEIRPYANVSLYDFKYKKFETGKEDFSGNEVVGVPSTKYSIGFDFETNFGIYMRNTFNYLSDVYTDFGNKTKVKGFSQYNAKLGYTQKFGNWNLDAFVLGNNLTNQINYTFLFVGNAVGDNDPDNGYPEGTITDVNPGPAKAYFMGGLNLSYHF